MHENVGYNPYEMFCLLHEISGTSFSHFLVKVELNLRVPKHQTMKSSFLPGTFKNPVHANRFAAIFEDEMQHVFWEFVCGYVRSMQT